MQEEFSYEVRVPQDRVGAVIGPEGAVKKKIETELNCKLEISSEGEVLISCTDGMVLYNAREIVKAIARGFNPDIAMQLLKPDYTFDLIELNQVIGKSKNNMQRVKARIIGKQGKSRKTIEDLTDTHMVIYGKTVGVIGEMSRVLIAREALSMLINGAMHKTVYSFLEKKRKEMALFT